MNKKEEFALETLREAISPLRFRIIEILANTEKPLFPQEIERYLAEKGYRHGLPAIIGSLSILINAGIVTSEIAKSGRIRRVYRLTDFGKTLFLILQEVLNKLAPSE